MSSTTMQMKPGRGFILLMVPRLEPHFKLERGHSTELSLDDLDVEPGNSREVRGCIARQRSNPQAPGQGPLPEA
jgi:hypothetical protein